MTHTSSEPKSSAACSAREEIVGQIRSAMTEIFTIHRDEVTAAIDGNFSAHDQLRGRLEKARAMEFKLIEKLRRHSQEHGC